MTKLAKLAWIPNFWETDKSASERTKESLITDILNSVEQVKHNRFHKTATRFRAKYREKSTANKNICRSVKFVTQQRGRQSEFRAKFAFVNCAELMSKLWCFVSNKIIAVGILRNVIFPDLTLPSRQNVYSCRLALAHRFISISPHHN